MNKRQSPSLLDSFDLGDLPLSNRIAMAPLTRARSGDDGVPTGLNATYYAQRAGFGLIISEGTNISRRSYGFELAPGLWSREQVAGWKQVTDAVRQRGGHMFAQLWHCGRVGAAGILNGDAPLSPSGINDDLDKINVYGLLRNGHYVPIVPTASREMTTAEVEATVREYRTAAANALAAGFGGVEIHGANGYLPHQFLSPALNQRTDRYGGSVAKRARFLEEIFEGIAEVVPRSRIGLRVSPFALYNNTRDPDPPATYTHVAKLMDGLQAGYLHFADMNGWYGHPDLGRILGILRPHYRGTLIANGGISLQQAQDLVATGDVEMVAFGRFAMANPDMVERLRRALPLAEAKNEHWYAAGAAGYTDYPAIT